MKYFKLQHILLFYFLIFITVETNAQNSNFTAVFSTKGNVYYSLDMDIFNVDISSNGKILSYAGHKNENIVYDMNDRIVGLGDMKVSWDYLNRLVSIGDVKFKYDIQDRLVSVGSILISYDFITGKINSLDQKPIKYDLITGKVKNVAGAKINYDIEGDIVGIEDTENITSIRTFNMGRDQ